MKLRLFLIASLIFAVLLGIFGAKAISASVFALSGKVTDSSGVIISGATIAVSDTSTGTVVANTVTDNLGNYSVGINSGIYNISVSPPAGTNFSLAIAPNYTILGNTVINFIFAPVGSVSLSGHIYGPLGEPLPNQRVILQGTTSPSVYTDLLGAYSFQVQPGNYQVTVTANQNDLTLNAPQQYAVMFTYNLVQSTVLDLTVPAKKVSVHVQDSTGSPISNVGIKATLPGANSTNLLLGSGIATAQGYSSVGSNRPQPQTDALGNTSAWLIPTNNGNSYTLTATPQTGSPYVTTTLADVTFTGDTLVTMTMQKPVTFSGHVYGPLGDPLPNQKILLQGITSPTVYTDSLGAFSVQVQAGSYQVIVSANNNNLTLNVPQQYLISFSYNIVQNATLDLTIPAKRVGIRIQDAFSNPISGVSAKLFLSGANSVNLPVGSGVTNAQGWSNVGAGSNPQPQTDSSGNANVWLIPTNNGNSYTLTATPQSGSVYTTTVVSGITFIVDTTVTVTMQQPVTLSGHVYGPLGDLLPNQRVLLQGSTSPSVYTDTSGAFSVQVQAGNYQISVSADQNDLSLNAPQQYAVMFGYVLNQNTVLDLTIPAKRVSFRLQDALGNALSNIGIKAVFTGTNSTNLLLGSRIVNAQGYSSVGSNRPQPQTDSSGNANVWLIPTNNGNSYSITATPPLGSIYAPFTLSNVSVTSDQIEIISLQYNHSAPVTTSVLSTQNSDGTYTDPTTVALSAIATTGYSIGNTYYTVDSGSRQAYLSLFQVSGSGIHTITYWSTDNVGVQEAPNTKTFTIHTNQPPVIGVIPNLIINEGGTYSTTGSFTDPDSTSWTGTVNYGDGSGVQTLAISGLTFILNHIYKDNGIYTVTVSITDNQGATGTATATVTVNNVAPTVGAITVNPTGPQIINTLVNASASFTDPGVLDTHTAVWSWGDGSIATTGVVTETNGSGSVAGSYTYTLAGVYTVTLTVKDKDGGAGTSQYQYIVIYDPSLGFVTGGGVSNDGSTFGISAKYTSTNSTPTGNTGYTFSGGNSVFASTSYNWLVITGATAFLSGQGTINGTGQYNFLVSATDGVPDMLRFKITDLSGTVIYDNQPGAADIANPTQAINHGQIKIH